MVSVVRRDLGLAEVGGRVNDDVGRRVRDSTSSWVEGPVVTEPMGLVSVRDHDLDFTVTQKVP